VSAPVQRAPGDVLVHLRRARDHVDRHHAEPLDLEALRSVTGADARRRIIDVLGFADGLSLFEMVTEGRVKPGSAFELSIISTCSSPGGDPSASAGPERDPDLWPGSRCRCCWVSAGPRTT
jgi:hypothetical protein